MPRFLSEDVEAAKKAIARVHENSTPTLRETRDALRELRDEIFDLLSAVEDDLRAERGLD